MAIEFHGAHLRRRSFPSPGILLFIVSFSKQFGSPACIFSCLLSIVLQSLKGISALEYSKYSWTSQSAVKSYAMKPYVLSHHEPSYEMTPAFTQWLRPEAWGSCLILFTFLFLPFHTQATPKPVNTTSLTPLTQTMVCQNFLHYQQGFATFNQIKAIMLLSEPQMDSLGGPLCSPSLVLCLHGGLHANVQCDMGTPYHAIVRQIPLQLRSQK